MADRMMTYEEAATSLGRSPEAVRQLCKRKHLRRTIGNDGKARVAIPEEMIAEASDRPAPERPPADQVADPRMTVGRPPADLAELAALHLDEPAAPTAPSADARALVAYLETRVAELVAELRDARVKISDLADQAAVLARTEAQLDAERRRAEELRADRDRLLDRVLAPPPAGIVARLRHAFGGR